MNHRTRSKSVGKMSVMKQKISKEVQRGDLWFVGKGTQQMIPGFIYELTAVL